MKMSKTSAELPLVVAAAQLANASMQGYLEKKRPSKKLLSIKYQRRWCLVYGNYFIYYVSPDDKVQKGSFSLESYRFMPCPGTSPYGFSLTSRHKRPFEFMASSKDDYRNWERAIQKGIALTRRGAAPVQVQREKHLDVDGDRSLYSRSPNEKPRSPSPLKPLPGSFPNVKNSDFSRSLDSGKPHAKHDVPLPERPFKGSVPNIKNSDISTSIDIGKYQTKSVGRSRIKSSKSFPSFINSDYSTSTDIRTTSGTSTPTLEKAQSNYALSESDSISTEEKSGSNTDSDDEDGYIPTSKINLPKPNTKNNNTIKENDSKSYTEDDYMTVLPNLETTSNKTKGDNNLMKDASDKTREYGEKKLEQLYSSVQRPGKESGPNIKNSDYSTSIDIGKFQTKSGGGSPIKSSKSFPNVINQSNYALSESDSISTEEKSGSNTDSDDEDGYIQTSKINLPKTNNDTIKESDIKSYTEDDYMTVLPNLETTGNKTKRDNELMKDASNKTSEYDEKKLEKIYSSVKRPGTLKISSESGYARVDGKHDDDSDSSEDDFINPRTLIDYGYLSKENLVNRLSSDYEKVDNIILPCKIRVDSSSSSCVSNDSSDSDDYTGIDDIIEDSDRYITSKTPAVHTDRLKGSCFDNVGVDFCDLSEQLQEPIYENMGN